MERMCKTSPIVSKVELTVKYRENCSRTLPESNWGDVSRINVLAPSVQQNEKCTFQLHIGESEVGDVQDSPDSLETGVDSERYRNL